MYSLPAWDQYFENSRSRELKNPHWIAIPNRLGTDDFAEIMSEDEGPAIYGIWVLLAQEAQKSPKRDGSLIRANGQPHDAKSLARLLRMDVAIVEIALKKLIEVHWLNADATAFTTPRKGAIFPRDSRGATAGTSPDRRGNPADSPQESRTFTAEKCDVAAGFPQEGRTTRKEGRKEERTATAYSISEYARETRAHAANARANQCQEEKPPTPDIESVRLWIQSHSGMYADDQICAQLISINGSAPLERIMHWISELARRRQKPEQNCFWYVALAKRQLPPFPGTQEQSETDPDRCTTCQGSMSRNEHAHWCFVGWAAEPESDSGIPGISPGGISPRGEHEAKREVVN